MEILTEEDISNASAKDIMDARKKEHDLVYEQKICLEYLEKVCRLSPTKIREMVEELGKISILKPRYIALIVNVLPDTDGETEALFSKERTNLKKEEVKQIVEIVKKYAK
jgi:DNA-directed RNA polymerase subunit F